MSERLLFFICFMWKSPLWYLGMLKIQFFYYFSITRPKNNVDSSKISLFLDVSIKRHTNKINERTFSFFFLYVSYGEGFFGHLGMPNNQSFFYF